MTVRLTTSQALVQSLMNQWVEVDGEQQRFFAGMWGTSGLGQRSGMVQALREVAPEFPHHLARDEPGMVDAALAFAKRKRRHQAFACLTTGLAATDLVTRAATATAEGLPLLLICAEPAPEPALRSSWSDDAGEVAAGDALRPVVRAWRRVTRPEQLIEAVPEVMRTLTSPMDAGAVFLALSRDARDAAFDCPEALLVPRVWRMPRPSADPDHLAYA